MQLAAELGPYETEGWRMRKEGNRFWASVTIDPIYEEGELNGSAKLTRNIARRHEAEEKPVEAKRTPKIVLS